MPSILEKTCRKNPSVAHASFRAHHHAPRGVTPTLVIRVKPGSMTIGQYRKALVEAVRQEFDYNITQQVYVSDEAWNHVVSAKVKEWHHQ